MNIIEEPQLAIKRRLPWFIDVLLYPASLHGIIQIAIFLFASFLIGLLGRFVLSYARHYGTALTLLLHMLLISYIFYYFAYCILDSAKGGRRAPDISLQHMPDKGDLISQLFLILGSVALCFCPAAVYYIVTERTDLLFWILSACGMFFFPMVLLRGVLFDSFDALNPIPIISSILSTFLPYCGLFLSFCIFAGFIAVILPQLPIWGVVSSGVRIYLLFVTAHILGGFYWWHKDKLDWGL